MSSPNALSRNPSSLSLAAQIPLPTSQRSSLPSTPATSEASRLSFLDENDKFELSRLAVNGEAFRATGPTASAAAKVPSAPAPSRADATDSAAGHLESAVRHALQAVASLFAAAAHEGQALFALFGHKLMEAAAIGQTALQSGGVRLASGLERMGEKAAARARTVSTSLVDGASWLRRQAGQLAESVLGKFRSRPASEAPVEAEGSPTPASSDAETSAAGAARAAAEKANG